MTGSPIKDARISGALADWRARVAALPVHQRDRATATLLALMRARTAAEPVLDSSTRFLREE